MVNTEFYPKRSWGSMFWSLLYDNRRDCYYKARNELLPFLFALYLHDLITKETLSRFKVLYDYLTEYEGNFPFATNNTKRQYALFFCFDKLMLRVKKIIKEDAILGKKGASWGDRRLKLYLNNFFISYGLNGTICLQLIEEMLDARVKCYRGEQLYFWNVEKLENGQVFFVIRQIELNDTIEDNYKWLKTDAKVVWKKKVK